MVYHGKRDTVLPQSLSWNAPTQDRTSNALPNPKPTPNTRDLTKPGSSKQKKLTGKSNEPYHKTYPVDQAGLGIIALKDIKEFPIFLLKTRSLQGQKFRIGKVASHPNLISLVDTFQSDEEIHFVYEYEHMAISLGCAAGVVQFTEADIATICKELLEGLSYIHKNLEICHGSLDCSNILLTYKGEVKIANIGESIFQRINLASVQKDIKSLGSLAISLIDPTLFISGKGENVNLGEYTLSSTALAFIEKTRKASSAPKMLKEEFLQLANPGGAWCLKRHYFETLPHGIRIGSQK